MRTHWIAPLAATCLALSACGEGGGIILTPPDDPPAACTDPTCGTLLLGLTATEGDFLSYAVDVVSIKLERSNGDKEELLPDRQRVDFVDLLEVSELVSATNIHNGTYVAATVRLDYTDAVLSVEVAGIPAATEAVDRNGNALGVVDLDFELDEANQVVVTSATPAFLQFDFDLAASHDVNILTAPVSVAADPFLVATTDPVDDKDFRARGPIVSVDTADGNYVVELRPFNHPDATLGQLTVEKRSTTVFEVDGEELASGAGLQAIADAGVDTLTDAQGGFDPATGVFTADRGQAGDSVPGPDFDVVIGNVHARFGNELTVRGGTLIRHNQSDVVYLGGDILVRVGPDTTVLQADGSVSVLDRDAISVGQRIEAFGDASASDVDLVLNATAGRVRLHAIELVGTVVDTATGLVTLDLFSIDRRNPQFFDFTDTGGSATTDADPADYDLDTGDLDLDAFDVDEPTLATGFATPFGDAPPDFTAATLVNVDDIEAVVGLRWGTAGTAAPFLTMGRNGFVVDVTNPNLGLQRFLTIGSQRDDIATLPEPLTIEPDTTVDALYAVERSQNIEVFRDFEAFADRVSNLLGGGSTMRTLTARGSFDTDTTTLTANYVAIAFEVP